MEPMFIALCVIAVFFCGFGIVMSRRGSGDFESHFSARSSVPTALTSATLLASSLGAWILFSPPSSATLGGVATIIGYALGSMSPLFLLIPLGLRIKSLMPQGYTLSSYVQKRYGNSMYFLVLGLSIVYPFIFICAEVTAIAKLMDLTAGIEYWLTAVIVLAAVTSYTWLAGLKASIITDALQLIFLLPVLIFTVFWLFGHSSDFSSISSGIREAAPHLLDFGDFGGLTLGVTLIIAVVVAEIFNQASWQRIYAAKTTRSILVGFVGSGVFMFCIVLLMGIVGLMALAEGRAENPEMALFGLLLGSIPEAVMILIAMMTLALVMSSADSMMNAIACLFAIDVSNLIGIQEQKKRLRFSRYIIVLAAIFVLLVAARGYSVFYMFLLVDLLCCACAYPVFIGLFNPNVKGRKAMVATLLGLSGGILLFPAADFSTSMLKALDIGLPYWITDATLFWSFVVALLLPILVVNLIPDDNSEPFSFADLAADNS